MAEKIEIDLKVPDEFFVELDRRFAGVAKAASLSLNSAMRQTTGLGGIGAGGSGTGGGGAGAGGVFGSSAASIFQGAGAGFLATQGSSAQSPRVLADNAAVGAANAGVGLAKAGLGALGAVVGGALGGPAGALAGGGVGSAVGDLVQAQFNSVVAQFEAPRAGTISELAGFYGDLAEAGIKTSRASRKGIEDRVYARQQRGYQGRQEVEREIREDHPTSLSIGMLWNWR